MREGSKALKPGGKERNLEDGRKLDLNQDHVLHVVAWFVSVWFSSEWLATGWVGSCLFWRCTRAEALCLPRNLQDVPILHLSFFSGKIFLLPIMFF